MISVFLLRLLSPTLVATLLLCAGCASSSAAGAAPAAVTPALHGDPARPAHASHWLRSELYFAIAALEADHVGPTVTHPRPTGPNSAAAQAQWRAFLNHEVTPRFRDGLTVLDGEGQWCPRGQSVPERLESKILVILHENTPQHREKIEAIRLAWKRATGHQSVLWSQQPVAISF